MNQDLAKRTLKFGRVCSRLAHHEHRLATTLISLRPVVLPGELGSLQSCDANHRPQNNPTNQVLPLRQQHNPSGPSAGQYVAPHHKNKNWRGIKIEKTQRQREASLDLRKVRSITACSLLCWKHFIQDPAKHVGGMINLYCVIIL